MSPRLSIIPAGPIFDRSLEGRDLQVLGLLGCHTDKAGWCSRSQVKMAAPASGPVRVSTPPSSTMISPSVDWAIEMAEGEMLPLEKA